LALGGGLMWLDSTCIDRYGKAYFGCGLAQQKEILDLIAYRKNAVADQSVSQAVEFFALLRNLTTDGFFTSEIGIKYLGYIGNTFLKEFPGCPPVPEG
jgi:gluconate 2-dehydrogenase gamma chain